MEKENDQDIALGERWFEVGEEHLQTKQKTDPTLAVPQPMAAPVPELPPKFRMVDDQSALEAKSLYRLLQKFEELKISPSAQDRLLKFVFSDNINLVLEFTDANNLSAYLLSHLLEPRWIDEIPRNVSRSLIREILINSDLSENGNQEIQPATNPIAVIPNPRTVCLAVKDGQNQIFSCCIVQHGGKFRVVTCAHCVVYCLENNHIVPTLQLNGQVFQLIRGRFPSGYIDPTASVQAKHDYGLFDIDGITIEFLSNANYPAIYLTENERHPFGVPETTAIHTNFNNALGITPIDLQATNPIFLHKCITQGGFSGSPILFASSPDETSFYLHSVHCGGWDVEWNYTCARITASRIDGCQ